MGYHIVLKSMDEDYLVQMSKEAKAGQCPNFDFLMLPEKIGATTYLTNVRPSYKDKLLGFLEAKPENWALARKLSNQLDKNDVIYCTSEEVAIPIAAFYSGKKNRPRIISFFSNLVRPRALLSTKLFRVVRSIDLFLVVSPYQGQILSKYLNVPESRIRLLWHKVDLSFFTPACSSEGKSRPVIASVGLEKRDYRLIAAATNDMDVEVKISGNSPHARQLSRSFPDVMPPNMSCRFYPWDELVQLYRDADIVIVSTFENNYAAGVTSLLEAMACKRPIIVTRTKGLTRYLDSDAMLTVNPGDVEGLKQAIVYLLNHPEKAKELAEQAYQIAVMRHSIEGFVDEVAACMTSMAHS
jgi:glycosyltransferase involved in cell wall biosynthesis